MRRIRSLLLVVGLLGAIGCISPVEYSDPLADFGSSPTRVGTKLGLVLTENVHTSLAHLNGILRAARRVPGNGALIAEIDPRSFNRDLNDVLSSRFAQIVPLEADVPPGASGVDLRVIVDLQVEIGRMSGQATSVKMALRFFDSAGIPIATIASQGVSTVPSPATSVGFAKAKATAMQDLARRLEASRPIAAFLDGQAGYSHSAAARRPAKPPRALETRPFAAPVTPSGFGGYHALVIGNAAYETFPRLQTAARDAHAVAELLRDNYGFEVELLTDVNRSQLFAAIEAAGARMTPSDNLLIYYAGHGWFDERAERGYWLPIDSQRDTKANWISNSLITDTLRGTEAKHVMIIADSCYSGSLTRGIRPIDRTPRDLQRMAQRKARVVLTSGGLEPVLDGGAGDHSVFAGALLRALRQRERVIDGSTLLSMIRRPVMLAADQTPEYGDIRMAGHDGGDFLFVPTTAGPAGTPD